MKYLRLFNEHSGYTEAMQTLEAPNVSHCVGENHVYYKPELPSVLPGNEEVWELYSSLVCDDEILEEDLPNIFAQYAVSVSSSTFEGAHRPGDQAPYTISGYVFTYSDGTETYKRVIETEVTWTNIGVTPPQATINDCGESIVEIGDWGMQQNGGVFE